MFALGVVAGLAGWFFLKQQLSPVSSDSQPYEFEVMPGWGASRVAAELEQAGLIRDARVFRYYLRFNELDRSVGEGLYDLDKALPVSEIAAALAAGGRPRTTRVIIPEGFRMQDIATRLAEAGFGSADDILLLMRYPGNLAPDYLPEDASLEGFLFPASYDFPLRFTVLEVLSTMIDRFEQELTPEIRTELEALGLTVFDWVTLSSMIQSEAGNSEEMPVIAGVFLNRMDIDMLMQSDPTVAYGLGKDMPELSAVAGDLRVDHPWNTYTRAGLPQGPISNPGHDALQAIFRPVRLNEGGQPYLYFLHGTDAGAIVFRPNISLQDHNRDIDRYLR